MNREVFFSDLKEKYFYSNFEYFMSFSSVELLLDILFSIGYDIFYANHVDFADILGIFAVVPIVYILICSYKSYKRGKVKLEIRNEEILIHRLYLLSPYRINKEQVIDVNVRETKSKTIVHIRTAKRKYKVKIYNE